jgi:hypothetical protein
VGIVDARATEADLRARFGADRTLFLTAVDADGQPLRGLRRVLAPPPQEEP